MIGISYTTLLCSRIVILWWLGPYFYYDWYRMTRQLPIQVLSFVGDVLGRYWLNLTILWMGVVLKSS